MKTLQRSARFFTLVSCAGHGVNDSYWFVFPIVLPFLLEHFGLRYATAGGILSAYLIANAVFSILIGKISDYLPRRLFIGFGFLVAAAGVLLSSYLSTTILFTLCLLFTAVGVSTYHPVMYAMINDNLREKAVRTPGKSFAWFEFSGLLTVLFLFIVSGMLVKTLHWQGILRMVSVPGIILGTIFLVAKKQFQSIQTTRPIAADSSNRKKTPLAFYILFFASSSLRQLSMSAFLNFAPTFLIRGAGFSPLLATYGTGFYFLGGLIATYLVITIIDRIGPFRVILIASLFMIPAIVLISYATQPWLLSFFIFLLGASTSVTMPTQNLILSRSTGRLGGGYAFGLLMGLGAVTNSMGPGLYGLLADRLGLEAALRLFAFPIVANCILLVFLPRFLKRIAAQEDVNSLL